MTSIVLDLGDPTPPYEQLRRGILEQIASGALAAGDRLPTVRALARDLGIAPGTVARSYKELEEAGVITTARGAGTRVAAGPPPLDPGLLGLMTDAVDAARSDGHSDPDILDAVRAALAARPEGSA